MTTVAEGNSPAGDVPPLLPSSALAIRNYRIFFIGGAISNAGRWMSFLTLPFVLNELTDRGVWVGLAGVGHFLPSALMGPWAGSLADRYPRRTILLISQSLSALVAATMAVMWAADVRSPIAYVAVSVLGGFFGGLGIPSWQAFISELVPRRLLLQGVALNSTQFSVARSVGPVIAGVLLKVAGPAWTFGIDAVSFAAALTALLLIRVPRQPTADRGDLTVLGELRDTVGWIRSRPGIKTAVTTAALIGFGGFSLTALLVLFADDVYHVGAGWLGWMTGLLGIGAVLAAPFVARAKSSVPRSRLELISLLMYSAAITTFALAPWFGLALVALPVVGAAHMITAATLNTAVQLQVPEQRRGKVLSVYLVALLAAVPVGQLLFGSLSDVIGPRIAVAGGAAFMFAVAMWLHHSGRLRHLDDELT